MTANETARADWNGPSGLSWVADADRRDAVLTPVLDALLAAASLQPGQGVLDVGCGCGVTSLAAADAVGPGGHVLGLDLSEPMLDVARRRAAARSAGNVELRVGDAQTEELVADRDLAMSRFGTMFFDDPAAAFANIASGLRPGGRLCIVTWQPLAANDWLTVPSAALARYGNLPAADPNAPGMFGQSSPETIRALLDPAGFTAIDVDRVEVRLQLGTDADEATGYLSTLGLARAVLEPLDPTQRDAALAAVAEALGEHAGPDGISLGAGILVTTARR